jgi:hypothetical protein
MTDIQGCTGQVGDEFSFEVPGVHYSKLRVSDVVPGELVVWTVIEGPGPVRRRSRRVDRNPDPFRAQPVGGRNRGVLHARRPASRSRVLRRLLRRMEPLRR